MKQLKCPIKPFTCDTVHWYTWQPIVYIIKENEMRKTKFGIKMKYCVYFQAGLIVVLIVTLMINISFIMETRKKLKRDQMKGRLHAG